MKAASIQSDSMSTAETAGSALENIAAAARHLDKAAAERLRELDLTDTQSILFFGSKAQQTMTALSDSMLEQVRSKDAGPAGAALNDMVLTLRGFDVGAAADARPVGWIGRLLGKGRGAAALLQRYEKVRDQIDVMTTELHRHQTALLIDIETLDRLYDANLEYVKELEGYIEAGEVALRAFDSDVVAASAADSLPAGSLLEAQTQRDLQAARETLERRVHDLRLSRQVAMQSLPSIRLVQDNDRSLVSKIDSTLVNTVPLWRQQLAQAVSIQRSRDAAQAVAASNDLTNDLLRSNAETLKLANRETREQIERGVFDIDAISDANRALIETIEDSLRIAEEGRAARSQAVTALAEMESSLKKTLVSASLNQTAAEHPASP